MLKKGTHTHTDKVKEEEEEGKNARKKKLRTVMSFSTEFPLRSFEFRLNFIYARTWEATQNTFIIHFYVLQTV